MWGTHIKPLLTQSQRRCMQLSWRYFCGICQIMPLKPNMVFRLQPSVNLHVQLQPSCSAALVPNVLPRREEGLGKPWAVISIRLVVKPERGLAMYFLLILTISLGGGGSIQAWGVERHQWWDWTHQPPTNQALPAVAYRFIFIHLCLFKQLQGIAP